MEDREKEKQEFQSIADHFKLLQADLISKVTDMVKAMMETHLEYHRENEHKWGIIRLMALHPFKTLLAGLAAGYLISGGYRTIADAAGFLAVQVFGKLF